MSRHISAPSAAAECSDYSASCIAAPAGEFQITLSAFDRPLQSSREGGTLDQQNTRVTGVQAENALSQCLPSGLLLTS